MYTNRTNRTTRSQRDAADRALWLDLAIRFLDAEEHERGCCRDELLVRRRIQWEVRLMCEHRDPRDRIGDRDGNLLAQTRFAHERPERVR